VPRPPPLTLISIPQIERRQPLQQKHDYAGLLDFSKLPDPVAGELAHHIAIARATHRKNGQAQPPVAGLTWPRMAAELESHGKKLRRGPNMHVRQKLQNPCNGLDTESCLHLKPLTAAPDAELLTAIEARQQEVALKPHANPHTQARESAGGSRCGSF
jgi:hypothetical protein